MVNGYIITEDEVKRMITWIEQARELLRRSNDVINKEILCKVDNEKVWNNAFDVYKASEDYLTNVWRTD
jgi:hypothetical protein